MKRIFIDTNIIIDILISRDGYRDALRLIMLSKEMKLSLHVSTLTMANVAYILRKSFVGEILYDKLQTISSRFIVDSLSSESFQYALDLRAKDFEDALQYFCAKENKCDVIITRNAKDFSFSDIPVMKASSFLSVINVGQGD